MENKKRKAKITEWENDGDFIQVRYTQEDGQRVEGSFYRVGWVDPPTDAIERARKALSKGPSYFAGPRIRRSS
jgi:hypothetical protein